MKSVPTLTTLLSCLYLLSTFYGESVSATTVTSESIAQPQVAEQAITAESRFRGNQVAQKNGHLPVRRNHMLRKESNVAMLAKTKIAVDTGSHVFKENCIALSRASSTQNIVHTDSLHPSKAFNVKRPDLKILGKAKPEATHQVIFAVKQQNLDELEQILWDVSNPASAKYGKHLTREQVLEMTRNSEATERVKQYVQEHHGGRVVKETYGGEYVTVEMKVSEMEKMFATEFYEFEYKEVLHGGKEKKSSLIRAASYGLPKELDSHVEYVFNTVHAPAPNHIKGSSNAERHQEPFDITKSSFKTSSKDGSSSLLVVPGAVTPGLLSNYYEIGNLQGSALATQALYESIGQSMSPSDLTLFEQTMGAAMNPISSAIGGHVYNDACTQDIDNCGEANLDVQYIMGVAWNVATVYNYWNGNDFMLDWITTAVNNPTPPSNVYSISYGAGETYFPNSYAIQFNNEAIKLGAMGSTIFVSAGDDGALSRNVRYGTQYCGYEPSFPATSPYVVAVGATQGPEADPPITEELCSTTNNAVITGGGGFSGIYPQPTWQSNAVNNYLTQYGDSIYPGYESTGRGYPDVSLLGHSYLVATGGVFYEFDGTSASSPVMASFVSLVNSFRVTHGLPTLGWITPTLYDTSSVFAWDIIQGGKNNCSAAVGYNNVTDRYVANCCQQGFPTTPGWDAATGLGSVNYTAFFSVFTDPGVGPTMSPTYAPTATPTLLPTGADDDANIDHHGSSNDDGPSFSQGAIAGIVIGGVIGLGIIAGLCYYVFFVMSKAPLAATSDNQA